MEEPGNCLSGSVDDDKKRKEHDLPTSPPTTKKLKQARLPFKILETASVHVLPSPSNSKKRKSSDPSPSAQKAPKTPKNDENAPRLFHNNKKTPKSLDEADNEVSSSSEAELSLKTKAAAPESRPVGLLDKFVLTTQQLEVSTSCSEAKEGTAGVDIIESDNDAEGKDISISRDISDSKKDSQEEENTDSGADVSTKSESGDSSKSGSADLDKSQYDCFVAPLSPSVGKKQDRSVSESGKEEDSDSNSDSDSLSTPQKDSGTPGEEKDGDTERTTPAAKRTPSAGSQKRMETKQKQKLERQKQRDEAKAERERLKQEEKDKKEREREEAKKKKDEEKQKLLEQKQKEKEEKLKQKEDERKKKLEQKEEELKKKQELLDAKSEEKKKKEEERKKKEEEKTKAEEETTKKKAKEMAFFQRFFTKSEKQSGTENHEEPQGPFKGFQLKKDMHLAPTCRVEPDVLETKASALDELLGAQDSPVLYVQQLRNGDRKPRSTAKAPAVPLDSDDVEIVDENEPTGCRMKAKFLKFHENYRPAYFGTWRKTSAQVGARRPLAKDKDLMDYEVDSDEEWEEEEPGESLSNSEGEGDGDDDKDEDEDDEDNDGFFVPHGYLSDDEGCEGVKDDEEEEEEGKDEGLELSAEQLKARKLAKAKAWDKEAGSKLQVLRPVCLGCSWWQPELPRDPVFRRLQVYQAVALVPTPIVPSVSALSPSQGEGAKDKRQGGPKAYTVPEEALPDLIRLVHGSICSVQKLIREFQEFWRRKTLGLSMERKEVDDDNKPEAAVAAGTAGSEKPEGEGGEAAAPAKGKGDKARGTCLISKRQLDAKIKELAVYEKREGFTRICWHVHAAVQESHELGALPYPSAWRWLTRPTPRPVLLLSELKQLKCARDAAAAAAAAAVAAAAGVASGGGEQPATGGAVTPKSTSRSIKQYAVAGLTPNMLSSTPPASSRARNPSDDTPGSGGTPAKGGVGTPVAGGTPGRGGVTPVSAGRRKSTTPNVLRLLQKATPKSAKSGPEAGSGRAGVSPVGVTRPKPVNPTCLFQKKPTPRVKALTPGVKAPTPGVKAPTPAAPTPEAHDDDDDCMIVDVSFAPLARPDPAQPSIRGLFPAKDKKQARSPAPASSKPRRPQQPAVGTPMDTSEK